MPLYGPRGGTDYKLPDVVIAATSGMVVGTFAAGNLPSAKGAERIPAGAPLDGLSQISTPHHADFNPAGDFNFRMRLKFGYRGAVQSLMHRGTFSAAQMVFADIQGLLSAQITTATPAIAAVSATLPNDYADELIDLGFIYDANNGAGNVAISLWTGRPNGPDGPWATMTQLGTTNTAAATAIPFSVTSAAYLGFRPDDGFSDGDTGFLGTIYRAEMRVGIVFGTGTVICDPTFTADQRRTTDSSGKLWTLPGIDLPPTLCIEGDSISCSPQPITVTFPVKALRDTPRGVRLVSRAKPGRWLAHAISEAATLDTAVSGESILAVFLGTNDLAGAVTAATLQGQLTSFITARKAAGWSTVIVFTALPRAGGAAEIALFNTWLRANWVSIDADALVDGAIDPLLDDYTDTTYYSDGVHPTAAGQAVLSGLFDAALTGLGL